MNLYIASTNEYAGKTLLALALGKIWGSRGKTVGYVKPLGKIPVSDGSGCLMDEDATFMAKEFGLTVPSDVVCPTVITQDLVMAAYRGEHPPVQEKIKKAVDTAAATYDIVLLGGSANLRDGVFFGAAPLDIVASTGSKVILVDKFEGEKSMDQILWASKVLGDRLLGVVFNRVPKAQDAFVRDVVSAHLASKKINVFGAIPSDPALDSVSVGTLAQALGAQVAWGEELLDVMIERFSVGAMDVEHALRIFRRISAKAVVTGGYRSDIQLAALETDTRCLVLTGGVRPNDLIRTKAKDKGVAILVVSEDTMDTVDKFEHLIGRLRIREKGKVDRGVALVESSVDTVGLLAALYKG